MPKVIDLNMQKKFPKEGELTARMDDLINDYVGELSVVAVLGILELQKHCLINMAANNLDKAGK